MVTRKGGFGCGMAYSPALIIIGYYFDKYRALATGIAVCGSAVGILVQSRLMSILLDNEGWRVTFRAQAAFFFVASLISLLFCELEPTLVEVNIDNSLEYEPIAIERAEFGSPSLTMTQREFQDRMHTLVTN